MSDTLFQKASDLKAKPEEGNSLKSRLVSLLSQSPSHDQNQENVCDNNPPTAR